MNISDSDWKSKLTEKEYRVLREKGTEPPFSGKYNLHFNNGVYLCKGCNEVLFDATSKFESGCGWPSFDSEIKKGKIKEVLDKSLGMLRVEIVCANCNSHLGHVFNDGPTATGLRYCVNSISLNFKEK
ncbi:MAG: peptide-methionine (R)-S-oxide reductase [Bacteroidetes bacterium HGW-Bacteroidetes-12]|jgi:peptide-methionine (R)-S-oxide reductase|nr:MAG: peptide-methionine (R)-S-oxide reductase [Bacteroidetes bacterium HGW-Bacteroidetes-12]